MMMVMDAPSMLTWLVPLTTTQPLVGHVAFLRIIACSMLVDNSSLSRVGTRTSRAQPLARLTRPAAGAQLWHSCLLPGASMETGT